MKIIKYALFDKIEPILDDEGFDTGETRTVYKPIQEVKAVLSPSKNSVNTEVFGTLIDYDRTMSIDNLECLIDENTKVYVHERDKDHTYIVKKRADSSNLILFALREIDES